LIDNGLDFFELLYSNTHMPPTPTISHGIYLWFPGMVFPKSDPLSFRQLGRLLCWCLELPQETLLLLRRGFTQLPCHQECIPGGAHLVRDISRRVWRFCLHVGWLVPKALRGHQRIYRMSLVNFRDRLMSNLIHKHLDMETIKFSLLHKHAPFR
jgi:hypothetical protein